MIRLIRVQRSISLDSIESVHSSEIINKIQLIYLKTKEFKLKN